MTTASDGASPRSHGPIARLRDVSKVYDSKTATIAALGRVTLDIDAGALTAVMGPSGSGKSTLMHVLAGLDRPSTGQVFIGEREITALDDEALTALRRRRIGFVFQAFNLVPTLTVRENILLPFELDDRKPTADERSWIDSIVKRLGIADRMSHRPNEISGGQQQRTAIARALATRPDILFADEPTGNLDARSGREVMRLMVEAVRDLGQTIVLVTHDPVVAAHANRVVFIADGTPVSELNHGISAEVIARSMLELDVDYDYDYDSDYDAEGAAPSRGEVP